MLTDIFLSEGPGNIAAEEPTSLVCVCRGLCLPPPRNLIPLCTNNPVSKALLNLQTGERAQDRRQITSLISLYDENWGDSENPDCVRVVVRGRGVKGSVAPCWPSFVQFPFYRGLGVGARCVIPEDHQGREEEGARTTTPVPAPRLHCLIVASVSPGALACIWWVPWAQYRNTETSARVEFGSGASRGGWRLRRRWTFWGHQYAPQLGAVQTFPLLPPLTSMFYLEK